MVFLFKEKMSEENKIIKAIKEKGKSIEAEMSFFDHLEVLRWHLIRSAIAISVFTILAFSYYDFIFNNIIIGPTSPSFWTYRMMCLLDARFDLGPDFCIKEALKFDLVNNEIAGQFTLQMNSSLIMGLVLGVPYLLYELWRFIKPGLTDLERKSASGFVLYATFLFALGIMFGYYIITPMSIKFLVGWTVSAAIKNLVTIDSYLSSVATLTLGTGIVFELPIVIYILSRLGVITPKFMKEKRRYASVIILIIAAIVTPTPDILTMLTVSFPLFLLYEISIWVSAKVLKNKTRKELIATNNKE